MPFVVNGHVALDLLDWDLLRLASGYERSIFYDLLHYIKALHFKRTIDIFRVVAVFNVV
jgi:hypothetical protein